MNPRVWGNSLSSLLSFSLFNSEQAGVFGQPPPSWSTSSHFSRNTDPFSHPGFQNVVFVQYGNTHKVGMNNQTVRNEEMQQVY